MPATEEEKLLVQMAELRSQVSSLSNDIGEIKASVKEVITLDRTIAELTIYNQQHEAEIRTQWVKIDGCRTDIAKVDSKADEWINKGRGAWFTLMILGSLAQAAVLGCVAYTFSHLRSAEDAILLMNQRVIQLEQKVKP